MRVITGSAKGRKLKMPKGDQTRPTTDMLKEAIFNILFSKVDNSRVLDLFAGSGSLGIEALSRGADYCIFVDSSKSCCQTIKENLQLTNLNHNAEVFCMEVSRFMRQIKFEPFDLVFIDPPYFKNLLNTVVFAIPTCVLFDKKTLFVAEKRKTDQLTLNEHEFEIVQEKTFGDSSLVFFKLSD